jgi:hypothetical protein
VLFDSNAKSMLVVFPFLITSLNNLGYRKKVTLSAISSEVCIVAMVWVDKYCSTPSLSVLFVLGAGVIELSGLAIFNHPNKKMLF